MLTLLRNLYDTQVNALNIVASVEQLDAGFSLASNEFFSVVFPMHEVPHDHPDASLLTQGFEDTSNVFSFNIGGYIVKEFFSLVSTYAVRVEPIDIGDFKLYHTYSSDYNRVCRYYLKQIEKDNMMMLKGAGIDQVMYEDVEDIQIIKDDLYKKYGVTYSYLVNGEEVV